MTVTKENISGTASSIQNCSARLPSMTISRTISLINLDPGKRRYRKNVNVIKYDIVLSTTAIHIANSVSDHLVHLDRAHNGTYILRLDASGAVTRIRQKSTRGSGISPVTTCLYQPSPLEDLSSLSAETS